MGSTGEFVAPSFVKKPALRQEDDGNRLVFECKLAGNPKPEVSWFREDVKIQNDERATFKVQEEGRNTFAVILELNDVVETDAGLYKVKAKNKYGEVSASINLNFSREYHLFPFLDIIQEFCQRLYVKMHFDARGPKIMIQSEAGNREVKFIGRNESTLSFHFI